LAKKLLIVPPSARKPSEPTIGYDKRQRNDMKINAITHEIKEGDYRAEIPVIPSCAT
jgi:hypothetical protein